MKEINTVIELKEFLRSMLGRNLHHAHDIKNVTPSVILFILSHANLNHPMKVKTNLNKKTGIHEPKNTGWIYGKKGKRYYVGYNHDSGNIEVRDKNMQGKVLVSLNDADDTYKKVSNKLKEYI